MVHNLQQLWLCTLHTAVVVEDQSGEGGFLTPNQHIQRQPERILSGKNPWRGKH